MFHDICFLKVVGFTAAKIKIIIYTLKVSARRINNMMNDTIKNTEGKIVETLKEQASKMPTNLLLWGAGTVMLAAIMLKLSGKEKGANFAGKVVTPLLSLGLYKRLANKFMKKSES